MQPAPSSPPIVARAALVALVILILASALISGPTKHRLLGGFPSYLHVDKLGHAAGFAAMGFAFIRSRFAPVGPWQVLAFALALGVFCELCQRFIPGRTAKLSDVLIDVAGTCVGLCVARLLLSRSPTIGDMSRTNIR